MLSLCTHLAPHHSRFGIENTLNLSPENGTHYSTNQGQSTYRPPSPKGDGVVPLKVEFAISNR